MRKNLTEHYFNPSDAYPEMPITGLNQFQYMEIVYSSPLNKMAKYLLSYFAFRYNFVEHRGCKAGVRRIERDLGLTKNTIMKWKKYLLDLGWISVKHRSRGETDIVYVRVGFPDPNVEIKENFSEFYTDPLLDLEAMAGVDHHPEEKSLDQLITERDVLRQERVSFDDFMESISEEEWV